MARGSRQKGPLTVRERCRHIFGDEPPVAHVWEPEFDYADEALKTLALQDWRAISAHQLRCYYFLNLVYHEPLQPELFRYLFPLCLATWHEELLIENHCYDKEDFFRALKRPYLWEQMMDSSQREAVKAFLCEGVLHAIDSEQGFSRHAAWLDAFNELAGSVAVTGEIWRSWWSVSTPGRAIALLKYASGFIWEGKENPLWRGFGPDFFRESWLPENLAFLHSVLTPQLIIEGVTDAAEVLRNCNEGLLAEKIARVAPQRYEIIAIRIDDLFDELARPEPMCWLR